MSDLIIDLGVNWRENRAHLVDFITVFGAKGGIGTTTIATNLAVSLSEHTKKDVIIVDLNLKFGNAALFLNVKPRYSIIDVAKNISNIDIKLLKNSLPKHASGVSLLASPLNLEESESINSDHVEQILGLLRDMFDYVIIDSNGDFDEVNIKAFDESDTILTISNLELPCIYNTKRSLGLFQRMGFNQDKVLLILNRYSANNGFTNDALEKSFEYPTFWRIHNQPYSNILNSLNQGIPISQMMPRSKLSTNVFELACKLNGEDKENPKNNNIKNSGTLFKKFLKSSKE